jgi:membrane-associated phospholipid phosphatase
MRSREARDLMLVGVLTLVSSSTAAGAAQAPIANGRSIDYSTSELVVTLVGLGASTAASLWVIPDHCRWCDRDDSGHDTLNSFDRSVRNAWRWSDANLGRADKISYATAFAPLTFLLIDRERASRDALIALEAYTASGLFTEAIKLTAARERPIAHFSTDGSPSATGGVNTSFVSQHTSGVVALVVALARSCALDDCGHQEVLWLAGLPLAATTGWLRIAGDQHYAIDVLAGAGVGVAAGLIIPELHRRRQRTHVSAAPTLHGGRVEVQYVW